MPRRHRDDFDRPKPRKSNNTVLWIALAVVGGVFLVCGGIGLYAFSRAKPALKEAADRTEVNRAKAEGRDPIDLDSGLPKAVLEPAPAKFDHSDPVRALHYWAKARMKAPYPLAEETGNAARDKRLADWEKERDVFISSRPVRWRVKITFVNANGTAHVRDVSWPFQSDADGQKWRNEKLAAWPFDIYGLEFSTQELTREPTFPFVDREWAKTLGKGSDAVLTGTIKKFDPNGGSFPVFYSVGSERTDRQKLIKGYTVYIPDGRLEKP